MNARILNRDFKHPDDGWYQIEPKGEHPHRPSGIVQVIDGESIDQIVNRFNADAEAGKLSHGNEMLIDHEHFKHDMEKETRAYGWLGQLQNRADGIYGQIRWTGTGKQAVDDGDYRFFSTEYDPADLKVLNSEKPKRVRPVRLDGLTLTNNPNNRGGRPITNRVKTPPRPMPEDGMCPDCHVAIEDGTCPQCGQDFADASASADKTKNRTENKKMKTVLAELDLSADASEESAHAAVKKLKNRIATLEPFEAENTTLKNRITALDAEQVDGLLAERKVTDEKVINRLKPVLAGMKDREERVAFLDDCNIKAEEPKKSETQQTKLFNRNTTPPKAGTETQTGAKEEKVQADKIMNRAQEIKRDNKNVTMATAVTMAQRELAN